MSILIEPLILPSHEGEGIFSGLGITPDNYEVRIQEPTLGGILWVNSSSDTVGISLVSSAANQTVINTKGDEIYLYNSTGSSVTVWVALVSLVCVSPISFTGTFVY